MKKQKNLTLELSSKSFRDDSEATMFQVCRTLFGQYRFLASYAEQISVMLWIADGSEILDYSGNIDDTFEWAHWCGVANTGKVREVEGRERRNTHHFPKNYIENVTPRTYRWLKRLIDVIRICGREVLHTEVRVGATYDNGPEFAVSDFKFKRHPEIAQADTLFPKSFVVCTAVLNADKHHYAAFPDGIPEGTSIGSFLGRQYKCFAKDMNYDYLWLSNGMGFGTETWGITGMLFDKKQFYPENAPEAAALMRQFWNDFFAGCPDCIIETRGTNFSAGIEIATDAAPLKEIFSRESVAVPVNSPWAALNYQSGREIAAYLSHIAPAENKNIPFRYYMHDPWFMNSPYLDRYGREPWDIFLPAACSRINSAGETESIDTVSFLSVDTTWGDMPERAAGEVSNYVVEALETAPDKAAPLVLVYPFEKYSDMVLKENRGNDYILLEELFLSEALQNGLPLNTVIERENFRKLASENILPERIFVIPVSAVDKDLMDIIEKMLADRGNILLYGALNNADEALLEMLKIKNDIPLTGEGSVIAEKSVDSLQKGEFSKLIRIQKQYSAGGLTETFTGNPDNIKILAEAEISGMKRVLAMVRNFDGGGKLGFVRGVLPDSGKVDESNCLFDCAKDGETFPVSVLCRDILQNYNWLVGCELYSPERPKPTLTIHRNEGAFYFSGFVPDTNMALKLGTPYGAPLLSGYDGVLANDVITYHPSVTLHGECRCFVKQSIESAVCVRHRCQGYMEYSRWDRRYISNLVNAEVRYFPPDDFEGTFEFQMYPEVVGEAVLLTLPLLDYTWEDTPDGRCAVIKNVSGVFYISPVK